MQPERKPEWIGVVVRYPDGSMRAVEMADDGTGCLDGPRIVADRAYPTTTTVLTLTTRSTWRLYTHDGPTADPFKASTAIAAPEETRKGIDA
jgi:hypothetical protein